MTLLEALVTIGVFVLLVALSIPQITGWYQTNQQKEAIALVSDALHLAETKALASENGNAWSVHLAQKNIILYEETGGPIGFEPENIIFLPEGSEIPFMSTHTITFTQARGTTDEPARFIVATGSLSTQVDVYTTGAISFQ